jgi:transposase
MIGLPAGTRVWIAAGVTDLRRGFTGLSGMVQTALKENPFSGHVFVFRGSSGMYHALIREFGDSSSSQVCQWREAAGGLRKNGRK